jgi:hypothetical protein
MSDELEITEGASGLDRRTFIKRSAIVGGMVWAAPAISTLGSRAFALENGTGRDCHAISYLALVIETTSGIYQFKVQKNGTCEPGGETAQCTPPEGWQKVPSTNLNGCTAGFVTDTSDDCCWLVTIPESLTVVKIVGVAMGAGGDKTEQGYCLQATYTNGGKVYQFCAPPKGTGELPAV